MSNKYIEIIEKSRKEKTSVFSVINKNGGYELAEIKWYSAWRQYCLFPKENTTWNTDCLLYVNAFIRRANTEHARAMSG